MKLCMKAALPQHSINAINRQQSFCSFQGSISTRGFIFSVAAWLTGLVCQCDNDLLL